jgi:glycerol-3-phosphate acyltransferase PlsX
MKIIVDAMGGDNAPVQILKGCALAVAEYGVEIILCGPRNIIEQVAADEKIDLSGMPIAEASQVIMMTDSADSVVKEKKDSSMAVGMKMLRAGEGDVFSSAGNTGAVITGATLLVKRMKGVKRAAIGGMIPNIGGKKHLLIDSGANVECSAEYLHQFAIMGSMYMKCMYGMDAPRVGLLNNGTEDTKGTDLQRQAHELLKKEDRIHYVGNIEGRDGLMGNVDVVVTDGFSGNIYLKSIEGMGKLISSSLKDVLFKNLRTKLGTLLIAKEFTNFKKSLDYTEAGGAPLLGVSGIVIKAHGSSNDIAFKNAIRQAVELHNAKIIEQLSQMMIPTEKPEI